MGDIEEFNYFFKFICKMALALRTREQSVTGMRPTLKAGGDENSRMGCSGYEVTAGGWIVASIILMGGWLVDSQVENSK